MRTIITVPDRLSYLHSKKNYLKINEANRRVWISETNMVTEELKLPDGSWEIVQRYNLKDLDALIAKSRQFFSPSLSRPEPTKTLVRCMNCERQSDDASQDFFVVCKNCFEKLQALRLKSRTKA